MYLILVYTTQVNSTFHTFWLVNSEVIIKYYSPWSRWREKKSIPFYFGSWRGNYFDKIVSCTEEHKGKGKGKLFKGKYSKESYLTSEIHIQRQKLKMQFLVNEIHWARWFVNNETSSVLHEGFNETNFEETRLEQLNNCFQKF